MKYLTITGADDQTDIADMVELSGDFPFLEWGILTIGTDVPRARFPSEDWIRALANHPARVNMHVSAHLCGPPVTQILDGDANLANMPALALDADRIQINTHGEMYLSHTSFCDYLADLCSVGKQIIFQLDGVNNHYMIVAGARGLNCTGLVDLSHGAGILPERWPESRAFIGYAGGLGPDNLAEQLPLIDEVAKAGYWIDMETRVRTAEILDLCKVRAVCEIAEPFYRKYYGNAH